MGFKSYLHKCAMLCLVMSGKWCREVILTVFLINLLLDTFKMELTLVYLKKQKDKTRQEARHNVDVENTNML